MNNCYKCGYCNRSIYNTDELVCTKEYDETPISEGCANYTKREDGNKYIKVGDGYWKVVDCE